MRNLTELPTTSIAWSKLTGQPSTLSGYGITDALSNALLTLAQNTTAPNATVPVNVVAASGASADIDLLIAPKGNGGLLTAVPDNTTTGGNKRGAGAIDLTFHLGVARTAANRVASGVQSALLGGSNNSATGAQSAVVGGDRNTASNTQSICLGGYLNTASGSHSGALGGFSCSSSGTISATVGGNAISASGVYAVALGGQSSGATAQGAVALGGQSNTANGIYSLASGERATTRGLYAANVRGSGYFSTQGDAQSGQYVARRISTDATPIALTFDNSTPGTTNQLVLGNNSSGIFRAQIVARRTDVVGETAAFEISGLLNRGANAASTVLASFAKTILFRSVATWDVAVTADVTNGGLTITVTGEAAKTIRWVCTLNTTEVTA